MKDYKSIVEKAGAIYVGYQPAYKDKMPALVMFQDKRFRTTLALDAEGLTVKKVKDYMKLKEKQWLKP